VYIYSLKEGINDGFLTPFKVKRIKTTLDDYIYTSDDQIIEGEVEEGKIYIEPDFNKIIEIKERESKRVQIFLSEVNQNEKAIVFCATQDHAAAVRDLINQYKKSDLFDVLEYVSFAVKPITREARVAESQSKIFALLNNKQKDFLEFVLSKYIETGVEELDQEKLPELLTLKYYALSDAAEILGGVENIRTTFIDFQKYLYERKVA
jgi:type I site-specific restriction endonuclease